MAITLAEYVGPHADSPDWTPDRQANAKRLLSICAELEAEMDVDFPINPATGSQVAGQTLGGFRPQCCAIGASNSAHKTGEAIDRYDPHGEIDAWLIANQDALERHGIYIEHPDATRGWSHWSIRRPGSGKHVFYP